MSNGLALVPRDTNEAFQLATRAIASGLFAQLRKPEEALVILMMGAELGLGPMQALRSIYVVSGKPVLSADLLVALVRRSGECASWRVVESTDQRCEIRTMRKGETQEEVCIWTMERAVKAGVTSKPTWKNFPAQMLKARAAAELARQVYPDVGIAGLYTPDEMESPQRVDVRVMSPDECVPDPEREAIQNEPARTVEAAALEGAKAGTPLPLSERLANAKTREDLVALRPEVVALPSGSSERKAIAAIYSEKLAKFDAPKEQANG